MPGRAMRFAAYRWLLIPVIALHNLEEWATVPIFGSIAPALAGRGLGAAEPPWRAMEIGWIIVTVVPAAWVVAAARARNPAPWNALVCWSAAVYLANVWVPHAVELIVGRHYAPGVATALCVNLPFCVLMLRQAVREHALSARQAWLIVAAGAISLVPVVAGVLWLAGAIARLWDAPS